MPIYQSTGKKLYNAKDSSMLSVDIIRRKFYEFKKLFTVLLNPHACYKVPQTINHSTGNCIFIIIPYMKHISSGNRKEKFFLACLVGRSYMEYNVTVLEANLE